MYDNVFTPLEPLDELGPSSPLPIDIERSLAQLTAPEVSSRMQAARVFCDIEEPRAIESLVNLLADPCPLVRVSAAYALGRNSDPGRVETLIAALEQDWNGYVRKGLVWALGNSRSHRAIPAIVKTLHHDITAVRLWSASALGQLATCSPPLELEVEIVKALTQALATDPIAAVRSNAAWALGQTLDRDRNPSAALTEPVCQLLKEVVQRDPDLGVRDDVQLALRKITGQEMSDDLW